MTRDRTYDPDEGEFVDFATLDDWRVRDEQQRAELERLKKKVADLEAHMQSAHGDIK